MQVAAITAPACTLLAETGNPLSRWSSAELAAEAVTRRVVEAISPSTVRRWLRRTAIKPWQHRSWVFPRDPDFEAKVGRVLDLYARTWQGAELGPDDYVISADEKSQLQALRRRHPRTGYWTGPPPPRRVRVRARRNPDLLRRLRRPSDTGDGHHRPKTGIRPFTELVAHVMAVEPYASARRVSGSWTTVPATADRPRSTA